MLYFPRALLFIEVHQVPPCISQRTMEVGAGTLWEWKTTSGDSIIQGRHSVDEHRRWQVQQRKMARLLVEVWGPRISHVQKSLSYSLALL